MRTKTTAAALAAVAITLPAATADAKLPSPSSKRIVPNRSIGTVKIGMPAETAVKKWGPGGSCAETIGSTCRWSGTTKQGSASFDVVDGEVSGITLRVGQKPSYEPAYSGPITRWKTSKRIGIGSTLKKVVKAYPKARSNGGGVEIRSAKQRTLFDSSGGRVAAISIVVEG